MKNFVQPGQNIDVTAPAAVQSGEPILVGDLFGIATADAESGATLVIATTGVYTLPKTATDVIAQGAAVYFDATAGEITVDSTGNPIVGHAVTGAGNPSATVAVRLSV
ncbi:MAG: DUF2190 family protein [Pseudomonadota bacterium]